MRTLFLWVLLGALGAPALAETSWPPPPEALARIDVLRAVMSSREASDAERRAAREELRRLLSRPGAPEPAAGERKPRAAIIPVPAIPPPAPAAPTPRPPVAAITLPPGAQPPVPDPFTGRVLVPSGKIAIDPATGAVLHDTPSGYVDPRTGRVVPK